MKPKTLALARRIQELESIADEVANLAKRQSNNESVQPELNTQGQRWYRGAREILVTQNSSGLREFDGQYIAVIKDIITSNVFVVGTQTHIRNSRDHCMRLARC